MFVDLRSNTSFFTDSFYNVNSLKNKLVKKKLFIEDLQTLNQIIYVKERDMDNGLKKSRKILINVNYFLI